MRIDIISDVVCPWCFIGKRNLEKFLALYRSQYPDREPPAIVWHPFQLNPHLAANGMPRSEYTAGKFGGPERARGIYDRVAHAGKAAGIDFRFDDIRVQPNSVNAHQLIALAKELGVQDAVIESLFTGFFLEGRDLSDRETLVDLAARGGLPTERAHTCLERGDFRELVEEADNRARALGVEGVPFFIFDQKLAVSGAQPPEVLLQAMQRVQDHVANAADE